MPCETIYSETSIKPDPKLSGHPLLSRHLVWSQNERLCDIYPYNKPLFSGHPLLSGPLERSGGCSLNKGFTVIKSVFSFQGAFHRSFGAFQPFLWSNSKTNLASRIFRVCGFQWNGKSKKLFITTKT